MTDVTDKYYREGTKLAYDKQYGDAILRFDVILKIDPLDDRTWVAKGVCHTHLQEYQVAYRSFGEALKINPNNKRALDNQNIVSQYINLEMPGEIPMPITSTPYYPPSAGKRVFASLSILCGAIAGLAIGIFVVMFLRSSFFLLTGDAAGLFLAFLGFGLVSLIFHALSKSSGGQSKSMLLPVQSNDPTNLPLQPKTANSKPYSHNIWLFGWTLLAIYLIATVPIGGIVIVLVISAISVGIDATIIKAGHGAKSQMNNTSTWKPVEWIILTFLFLIIIYPLYLIKRRAIFERQYSGMYVETSSKNNTFVILGGFIIFFILMSLIGSFGVSTILNSGYPHKTQNVISPSATILPTPIPTSSKPHWGNLELTEEHTEMGDYGWGYISGTVKNRGGSKYSMVIISANLYDDEGNLLGNSRDLVSDLEPYGSWRFNIPVMLKGAEKYKITDITSY